MTTMLLHCLYGTVTWIYNSLGEKSTSLKWYITEYTTKAEKGYSNAAFTELAFTKSLASRL